MIRLFDLCGTSYADDTAVLPPIGDYYAIMSDYNAQIFFIDEVQHTILVIEYLLVSCESMKVYEFTETYDTHFDNPRFSQLNAYLQKLFSEDELDFEENLTPTFERIKLRWEFLGGYAYPIISEREYLFNPYKEEEYTNRIDEILNKARDMLNASEVTPFDSLEEQEEKTPPSGKKPSIVKSKLDKEVSFIDSDLKKAINPKRSSASDLNEV